MSHARLSDQERAFLSLLNDNQVEYLVIGGYAVIYHGYHRPIADLDIWVAIHKHNAQKLVNVLRTFGHGLPTEAETFFESPDRVIRIGIPPFRIEHFQSDDRFIHLGIQPP